MLRNAFEALALDSTLQAVRDALAGRLRTRLVNDAGDEAFVKTTAPDPLDPGLVVRQAGDTRTWIVNSDGPVDDGNPLPVVAQLADTDGLEYTASNPLPVDIGTVEVNATFSSVISEANSYVGSLAPGGVFAGEWEDVNDYATISTLLVVDGVCQISRQFSLDGVEVDYQQTAIAAAGFTTPLSTPAHAQFFRFVITNFGAPLDVRLETAFHFNAPSPEATPVAAPMDDLTVTTNTSALLHGRVAPDPLAAPGTPAALGVWKAIKTSLDGVLSVAIDQVLRARGENTTVLGVLTAGALANASQSNVPGPGRTVVMMEVPDGHSSTQIRLYGTFSAASQVHFEGSADGADDSWFALNQRRNITADDNSEFTLLDANPFGGAFPGAGNSNWRGSPGGVRFFRVRCSPLAPGDAISVRITTSTAGGPIFQQGPPPLPTDSVKTGMLNAVGDTVLVSAVGTAGWSAIMQGQFSGTVRFEQSVDGTTWRQINGAVAGVGSLQTSLVGTGQPNQVLSVRGSSGGLARIRLRADNDFAGTFTGTLRAGAGSAGVFLTAAVPIAGLSAGAQTTRNVVGTTASRIDPAPLAVRTTVEVRYQLAGAANNGSIWVGFTPGVTSGNGRGLVPGEAWTLDLTSATALYAVASAAGQQVQVTEIG